MAHTHDAKIRTTIAIAALAAVMIVSTVVSLAHYDAFPLRLGIFVWSIWPYPMLWVLATRLKRRSTRLFWSAYMLFALLLALVCYVGPLLFNMPLLGIGWMMAPGYLLIIGLAAFVVFLTIRWIGNVLKSKQSQQPTRISDPSG
jgi:hypothetical protein